MNMKSLFVFLAGFVVGSGVTYYVLTRKDEYEEIVSEEEEKDNDESSSKSETKTYSDIIADNGYTDISKKEVCEMAERKPYIIPPEEFDMEDYDTCSLTYYSDGILADENNDIIEDVEDTVGEESLTHFGEYEDDSVFVRNDKLKIDYEILLDIRRYEESL